MSLGTRPGTGYETTGEPGGADRAAPPSSRPLPFPASYQAEHHWIRIGERRMHFLKAGSGPPLILLHGMLGSASAWEPVMGRLAAGSTTIAIDALGIGASDRGEEIDPGLKAQADRVVEVMKALEIRSADFLATSHGGAVATVLAAAHPGRVRSLLLQAPVNPFCKAADPVVRFYRSRLGRWCAYCIPSLPVALQMRGLGRMYGDPSRVLRSSLERYMTSLRVPGTVNYVLSLIDRWFDDMPLLAASLERVRQFPALLLWGERDRAVSLASARPLRECFDRSELVILPGAGHLPYEEFPQLFSDAVTAFLQRTRGQARGQGARRSGRVEAIGGSAP